MTNSAAVSEVDNVIAPSLPRMSTQSDCKKKKKSASTNGKGSKRRRKAVPVGPDGKLMIFPGNYSNPEWLRLGKESGIEAQEMVRALRRVKKGVGTKRKASSISTVVIDPESTTNEE